MIVHFYTALKKIVLSKSFRCVHVSVAVLCRMRSDKSEYVLFFISRICAQTHVEVFNTARTAR